MTASFEWKFFLLRSWLVVSALWLCLVGVLLWIVFYIHNYDFEYSNNKKLMFYAPSSSIQVGDCLDRDIGTELDLRAYKFKTIELEQLLVCERKSDESLVRNNGLLGGYEFIDPWYLEYIEDLVLYHDSVKRPRLLTVLAIAFLAAISPPAILFMSGILILLIIDFIRRETA